MPRNRPVGFKVTADEYADLETVRVAKGLRALAPVFRTMSLDEVRREARRIRRGLARVQ